MRKRMIAGNWKMNKTFSEAIVLAQGIVDELSAGTGDVDVVVAPPAVDLKGVSEVLTQANSSVALSAQNVYWEESGAYTGETAPSMLESVGATHCIIGHSERRGYFGETDEDINRKAKALRAIGTGKTATADDAQEVCGAIRKTLAEIFGPEIAAGIRVLYGGSAKPENINGFLEKEDVDGALVGGASLKADSFAAMVKSAMN